MEDEHMTPESYPKRCDADVEGLEELRERFDDEDDPFAEFIYGDWPPSDHHGNVYPIFFEAEDVNAKGKIYDSHDDPYPPFAGHLAPVPDDDICNTPLARWRDRYPNIRYCGGPARGENNTFCPRHNQRKHVTKTAEEAMQTGAFVSSVDHLYAKLDPWKKLVGWGTFESLMGESNYEFAPEYEIREFDFSDETFLPDGVNDDGILEVKCGYPTDHPNPALYLYVAAMQTVQMMSVQPQIMYEDRDEGEGMMERRTVEKAQLTSPTESDPSQNFKTIPSWSEHHLNLPMARLIDKQPKLLEMGGVDVDPENLGDGTASDDIVLEIEADPEDVETVDAGTDPNAYGIESESSKILDKANDDESTQ